MRARGEWISTFKRGIVGGLGVFGLLALLSPWSDARDQSGPIAWMVFVIHLLGPVLALALLSLWPRWRRLKPDVRVGLGFLATFVLPLAGLTALGTAQFAGRAIVALIVALSMTALWWVAVGQKLDESSVGQPTA
jgi:hypothetical protein